MSTTPKEKTVAEAPAAEAPVNTGLQYGAPVYDARREALQRQAMVEHQIKQNPGQFVRLPGGNAVRIQSNVGFKYPGQKVAQMLGRPELYLKNPKPPFDHDPHQPYDPRVPSPCRMPRYAWRVRTETVKDMRRDEETRALHEAGRIKYVETDEIDPRSEMPYTAHATTNNRYVTTGTQILCEIMDPQLSYDTYKAWDDQAIAKAHNLPAEIADTPNLGDGMLGHVPDKSATKFDKFASDPRQGS